jgi:glycine/sarcosine N-methyltransferase
MVAEFYNDLAETYHALYPDWRTEVVEQAAALDRILGVADRTNVSVADVACGVGTQLIGLAQLGYNVGGSDLSPGAIATCSRECINRGLRATLAVADMRKLPWASDSMDAVVCADNALPHLLTDDDVVRALVEMARILRPGGVAIITSRDYDEVLQRRPEVTLPQVSLTDDRRLVSFQLWRWRDRSDIYDLDHFQTHQAATGEWRTQVRTTAYRAYRRDTLSELAKRTGLADPTWHMPSETGFFQPLMTAHT